MKLRDSILSINEIALNSREDFQFGHIFSWANNVLESLISKNMHEEIEDVGFPKSLKFKGEIQKKNLYTVGNHILIDGTLEIQYPAQCIRCLKLLKMNVKAPVKLCFLDERDEATKSYEEEIDIDLYDQIWDLHLYDSNEIDFTEILMDMVHNVVNHYPLHDQECKGLCQTCGHNLNEGDCVHQEKPMVM